jgi:predicted Zn-dependent protease
MTTLTIKGTDGGQVKWADPTDITWSIATSNLPNQTAPYNGFISDPADTATFVPLIEQAESAWAAVANIAFEQVPDSASADIRFGFGNLLPSDIGKTWYGFNPSTDYFVAPTVIQIENPANDPTQMTADGLEWTGTESTVLQTLTHEIGHALGLTHSTDDPSSIMWPNVGPTNPNIDVGDITAIQSIYGAPEAPNPLPAPPPPPPPSLVGAIPIPAGNLLAGMPVFATDLLPPLPSAMTTASAVAAGYGGMMASTDPTTWLGHWQSHHMG